MFVHFHSDLNRRSSRRIKPRINYIGKIEWIAYRSMVTARFSQTVEMLNLLHGNKTNLVTLCDIPSPCRQNESCLRTRNPNCLRLFFQYVLTGSVLSASRKKKQLYADIHFSTLRFSTDLKVLKWCYM